MRHALTPAPRALDAKAIGALIVLATLIVSIYSGVGSHDFVDFDDYQYVLSNPGLDGRLGLDDLRRAFLETYASNWAPLHSLSLALSDALHGDRAGAYAWTNVFLHTLAAGFLFLALRRMTGRWIASFFVAAVFAVHPLHVESVAWISQRKDVLAAAFWMSALFVYAGRIDGKDRATLFWVFLLSACAMMAKATAVAIPITLVLLDFWPLGRVSSWPAVRRIVLEKIPIALAAAAVSLVTLYAQTESGANASAATSLSSRLMNAAVSYCVYVADTVWPHDLAFFYPYAAAESIQGTRGIAALVVIAGVTLAVCALWRRAPALLTGWFWFLVVLLPMIGVVQVGEFCVSTFPSSRTTSLSSLVY